jgi:hypothetical protein
LLGLRSSGTADPRSYLPGFQIRALFSLCLEPWAEVSLAGRHAGRARIVPPEIDQAWILVGSVARERRGERMASLRAGPLRTKQGRGPVAQLVRAHA